MPESSLLLLKHSLKGHDRTLMAHNSCGYLHDTQNEAGQHFNMNVGEVHEALLSLNSSKLMVAGKRKVIFWSGVAIGE